RNKPLRRQESRQRPITTTPIDDAASRRESLMDSSPTRPPLLAGGALRGGGGGGVKRVSQLRRLDDLDLIEDALALRFSRQPLRSVLDQVGISAERVRYRGDGLLRLHAVAGVVERRRHDGDAELAGRHRNDPAADAALSRQS